ncbi:histidinol-phosphate transaminase [Amycolatopsis sp. A133]|uniref:histidinol-phosphate transaminase n=1 Tax=Amycolatopsis sp. A133 TaxID=3064472 RepID=UPI0027F4ACE1|nr:histidinol-phosphate transaminase [Amycolatopsis sp. A133]MDQ7807509.1 histidinol-phosphate transaminase [Amycolatopsis sp. A133]
MTRFVRPEVARLPGYPAPPARPAVQLAGNELPWPPLPEAAAAAAAAVAGSHRYPAMRPGELITRLARLTGLPAGQVAVGPGSGALLQHLMEVVFGGSGSVVFGWPSFEAYPVLATVAGARPVPVPLTAGHGHDLDAMAAAVGDDTRMVLLCNPNNPTGSVLHREALLEFLRRLPPHVLVVLDEAYREFVSDPDSPDGIDLVRELGDGGSLVSLRTFSKAHGLAGLRVGYCAGPPAVIAALDRAQLPFTITASAEAAALASLAGRDQVAARCRDVRVERGRVRETLRAHGFAVPESHGNFLWLPLAGRAGAFAAHCLAHGVLVRPFPGEGVRTTIGSRADNNVFLTAAESWSRLPAVP